MIFHVPDFLMPPQALGALRAVRDVRVRSAGAAQDITSVSYSPSYFPQPEKHYGCLFLLLLCVGISNVASPPPTCILLKDVLCVSGATRPAASLTAFCRPCFFTLMTCRMWTFR